MALWDNTIHYWTLDEADEPLADSVGDVDIFKTSSLLSAAGKLDQAKTGDRGLHKLESTASLDAYATLTVCFWMYLNHDQADINTGLNSITPVLLNGASTGTPPSDSVGFNIHGGMWAYVGGVNSKQSAVALQSQQWHLVIGKFVAGSKIGISIDGGAFENVTETGTTFFAGNTIELLNNTQHSSVRDFVRVDEVAVFDRELSDSDASDMWNSGSGKFYPAPSVPDSAAASWSVSQPQHIGALTPNVASASWSVPNPTTDAIKPAPVYAIWHVAEPDRIGAATPDVPVATWSVSEPRPIGPFKPTTATATWTVGTPEKIGSPPDSMRLGSINLRSSKLASVSLIR